MTARRGLALVLVLLGALKPAAGAQTMSEATPGACPVRVAAVVPLDPRDTLLAVVLEPVAPGTTAFAAALALFTSGDRRYDVAVEDAAFAADAPLVRLYRFPAGVRVTGAYVAAFGAPAPQPCALADPWTGDIPADAAQAIVAAMARPSFERDAVAVTATATPDPLRCRVPTGPARMLREAPPDVAFFQAPAAMPQGTIAVRVVVAPDGRAFDARVDRASGTIDETAVGTALKAGAVAAAMRSTYAPATFRCRPIAGIAAYVIDVRSKRGVAP